jgi:hypothetical protein
MSDMNIILYTQLGYVVVFSRDDFKRQVVYGRVDFTRL